MGDYAFLVYLTYDQSCSMSLMTTKMVVQKKLRELIHPELIVVNVDGTPENALPENYYTQETYRVEPQEEVDEVSVWDKVKNIFKLAVLKSESWTPTKD